MITGLVLVLFGLAVGLMASMRFNVGNMMIGWVIAGIGAVVFVVSFVRLP